MGLILAASLALLQAAVTFAPLDARWITTFETPPSAAAGFDDGAAYVPLKGGTLVAVDLERGTVRWTITLATSLTPATGDGLVFTAAEGVIQAFDRETGAERWRTPLPGGTATPLYWDTGWLVASTTAGDLAAFRATDGALIWRQALGSPLSAQPAPALDRLYLGLADGRLLSVSLATGDTLWSRQLAGRVTGLLALDDQLVFGTSTRDVTSVGLTNGRNRWTWKVGGDVAGLPSADERHIYFAARDNVLRAVDRRSGNLRWKASLGSRPSGGPIPVNEVIVVPFISSEMAGFDPVSGEPAITLTAAGEIGAQPYLRQVSRVTAPRLITVSRDGKLQGFGLRFELPPAPLADLPGSPAVP